MKILSTLKNIMRLHRYNCYVLSQSQHKRKPDLLPANIFTQKDEGVSITYTTPDGIGHDYITDAHSWLFELNGKLVFPHNTGQLYQTTTPALITSDYWNQINNSHIGSQITTDTKELREGFHIPWKIILISLGVIIVLIVLWQNGFLESILKDIIPSPRS